jgi:hypothetical protein
MFTFAIWRPNFRKEVPQMARDPYAQIFQLSTGYELETELIDMFGEHFYSKGKVIDKSAFRFATAQEDKEFGTDAFIWGVPCDFTCNFAGKNYTTDLQVSVKLPGVGAVRFGVRTGNGVIKFETPVLVIGIESLDGYLYKNAIRQIIDSVRRKIDDVIEVGQDAYWNWVDAQETTA